MKTLLFMVVLLALSFYTHVFTIMQQRPQSVHMWAMCDRGSVARNYAQESMDFFKPRVHETKEGEGITGLEFPVMNYLAAICYKLFGFNEFWYRFLMFIVYAAGLFSAYLITGFFLKNLVYRYLSVLMFSSTPVLTYYAAGFIPDTAALGFILMGWYFFFAYLKDPLTKNLIFLLISITLASLIKITAAIGILLMIGLAIWSYIFPSFELTTHKSKRLFIPLAGLISLALAFGWIQYAKYLNETYGLSVFLMKTMRPENFEAIKTVALRVNEIWVQFYFYKPLYYIFLVTFIFLLIGFRKADSKLRLIFLGYLFGVLAFAYLMFIQFNDHDYYIITLLPLLFFLFLAAFNLLEKLSFPLAVSNVISISLIVITALSWNFNRKHQEFRMDENCWLYGWSRYKDYQEVEPYVTSLGISKNEKAIAILDYSPNIALYFLNLKGWSVADVADDEGIRSALAHHPSYVVINDTNQLKRPVFLEYPLTKKGQFKSIGIYTINYK